MSFNMPSADCQRYPQEYNNGSCTTPACPARFPVGIEPSFGPLLLVDPIGLVKPIPTSIGAFTGLKVVRRPIPGKNLIGKRIKDICCFRRFHCEDAMRVQMALVKNEGQTQCTACDSGLGKPRPFLQSKILAVSKSGNRQGPILFHAILVGIEGKPYLMVYRGVDLVELPHQFWTVDDSCFTAQITLIRLSATEICIGRKPIHHVDYG